MPTKTNKKTESKKVIVKKAVKKVSTTKTAPKPKTPKTKPTTGKVQVYSVLGKFIELIDLPEEVFGQKPNMALLAQALRVYESRSHPHNVSTKTRSNVRGGGAKPWRQKGTGRARAGSIRSPLWVGGGVALGPTPGKRELTLPKKMKKKALIYALSLKKNQQEIKIIAGIEKLEPKTKSARALLDKMEIKGSSLFVLVKPSGNLKLALRNIPEVAIEQSQDLNAYKVLSVKNLLISKEVITNFA